MKKNALLLIDCQYDFTNPNGALYVPGADKDMERLSEWIIENAKEIDSITVTLDSHHVNDISHPQFWQDKDGNNPPPFTQITSKEIEDGIWTPRFNPSLSLQYVKDLESQGEFPHFIWPVHCLVGSKGAALDDKLVEALKIWSKEKGNYYTVLAKGLNPMTEHFGIFCAQVPIEGKPETQINQKLIQTLEEYQNVYFAGEAKSHCVATTLKQAMKYAPSLAQKFIILEDVMSDVTNLGFLGEPIYNEAKSKNIRFSTTKNSVLNLVTV